MIRILVALRWILLVVLAIGLPAFIYLAFIAKDPVFPPEQDVALGRQTVMALEQDPEEYPVLDPGEYPEAYAHLDRIVDRVVASPEIQYRDIFAYDKVRLIHRDDLLNAFCTPGGFIYVFTGLIRYLDAEDHLAGVLGHEISHAERRHGALQLQRDFGVNKLLQFAALTVPVSPTDVVNAAILKELTGLKYGRGQESQADADSVHYLATSDYACDGAAGFFAKILAEGDDARVPELLSSHPDSAARVAAIGTAAQELGCSTALASDDQWVAFQESLPPLEPMKEGAPSVDSPDDDGGSG